MKEEKEKEEKIVLFIGIFAMYGGGGGGRFGCGGKEARQTVRNNVDRLPPLSSWAVFRRVSGLF